MSLNASMCLTRTQDLMGMTICLGSCLVRALGFPLVLPQPFGHCSGHCSLSARTVALKHNSDKRCITSINMRGTIVLATSVSGIIHFQNYVSTVAMMLFVRSKHKIVLMVKVKFLVIN